MSNKTIKILCYLCLISSFGQADTFETLIKKNNQSRTTFSVLAVDALSGRTIYQQHPDKLMIPASNMKVVTSSAALHYLGEDYAFETKIGFLDNDLVIVGGGDPLLADPKHDSYSSQAANTLFSTIIDILKKTGISSVENIILDTSFFDNNQVHPSWPRDQLNQWYACEISGLNFYNNCVHIEAARNGNRVILKMTPENNYIHLVDQLRLISKGSSAVGAYRNSTPNKLLIKGNLNQKAGFDVAIENPAGLFGSILNNKLSTSGISVKGKLLQRYVKNQSGIRYLVIFKTPIKDVLKRCNTDSLGLAAECLVKTISAENTQGRINGEWEHGLKLISRYLNSLKVSQGQYILDDGSGLSRNNRITTRALVTVLKDVKDSDVFTSSLAVGGESGTIKKYFKKAPYKGNIIGKTGYISGVRSFSGICNTPRGDVIFSILTENGNGYTRRCINEITQALYDGTL